MTPMSTQYSLVIQAENKVNAGIDAAEKEFRAFDQRMKRMRDKEGAGGGGILDSTLGKLAVGGGALAAMEAIGGKLAQATERAVDLKKELQAGTITTEQFVAEQAKALPIVGNVVKAFENGLELLTGWKSESASMVAQAESTNKIMEARLATQKLGLQYHDQHLDRMRQLHQQEQLLNATGAERLKLAQDLANQNALSAIDRRADSEVEGIRERNKAAGEAARKELEEARSRGRGRNTAAVTAAEATLEAVGADEDKEINAIRERQAEERRAQQRLATGQNRQRQAALRERAKQDAQRMADEESQAEEAELRAQGQNLLADDVRSRRERDKRLREIERDRLASREGATPGEFGRIDAETERRRRLEQGAFGRRQQESVDKYRRERLEELERRQREREGVPPDFTRIDAAGQRRPPRRVGNGWEDAGGDTSAVMRETRDVMAKLLAKIEASPTFVMGSLSGGGDGAASEYR